MENFARPPCYGCGERHSTCHIGCECYNEYRAFMEKKRNERIKDSLAWGLFNNRKTQNIKYKQRVSGHNAVWRGK